MTADVRVSSLVPGTVLSPDATGAYERIKVLFHKQGRNARGGTDYSWHQDRFSVPNCKLTVVGILDDHFSELGIWGADENPNYGDEGVVRLLGFHGALWHEVLYDGEDDVYKLVVHYGGEWREEVGASTKWRRTSLEGRLTQERRRPSDAGMDVEEGLVADAGDEDGKDAGMDVEEGSVAGADDEDGNDGDDNDNDDDAWNSDDLIAAELAEDSGAGEGGDDDDKEDDEEGEEGEDVEEDKDDEVDDEDEEGEGRLPPPCRSSE